MFPDRGSRLDLVSLVRALCRKTNLPTTKLRAQKKAWTRYNLQVMNSCRIGVIWPTSQLNAQLVAVDKLAPLERILSGRISGGYSHGIGPHEYPNAALYTMTRITTMVGVEGIFKYIKYEIADSEITMATAPLRRMGLRPQLSTIYQGGMVERK